MLVPTQIIPRHKFKWFCQLQSLKGVMVLLSDFSFPPTPYLAQALSLNHTPLRFLCYGWLLFTFLFPLFKERDYIMLQAAHRANRSWLPFPRALNILKIFVILLATGGYNSLLAESKSTSCQRIPETICMILKSKNKMKWFYSHPTLPHILTTESRALVLKQKKPHHLLLAPASHLFISRREGLTHIWDIQISWMQIMPRRTARLRANYCQLQGTWGIEEILAKERDTGLHSYAINHLQMQRDGPGRLGESHQLTTSLLFS